MSVRPIAGSASLSWLTPHGMGNRDRTGKLGGGGGGEFAYQANNWPTAQNSDWKGANHSGSGSNSTEDAAGTLAGNMQNMLSHQVQAQAQSGEMSSAEDPTSPRRWGTPRVTTNSGIGNPNRNERPGTTGANRLEDEAATFTTEQLAETRKRLNPKFVEWLMGWPEGWLDLSSFVSSATE